MDVQRTHSSIAMHRHLWCIWSFTAHVLLLRVYYVSKQGANNHYCTPIRISFLSRHGLISHNHHVIYVKMFFFNAELVLVLRLRVGRGGRGLVMTPPDLKSEHFEIYG